MTADSARVGEETVKRHDSSNSGEDGEEREERNATGGGENSILRDRPQYSPKDIGPSTRRDFLWSVRFTTTPPLASACHILCIEFIRLANVCTPVIATLNRSRYPVRYFRHGLNWPSGLLNFSPKDERCQGSLTESGGEVGRSHRALSG